MQTKPQYPWDKIRVEYEAGESMPQLAEKYGFAESTGYKHKRKEGWKERNSAAPALNAKTREKVLERLSEGEAELRLQYTEHVKFVRRKTIQEIKKQNPNYSNMKAYRAAADILERCKLLDWDLRRLKDAGKDSDEQLEKVVDAMIAAAEEGGEEE